MRDIPTRLLILLMAMTLVIAVVPAAFAAEPVRMGVDGGAPAEYASLEDAFAKLETDTPTASARILVSGSGETVTPRIFKGFDLSILSMDDQRIELKLAPLSFANGTLSIQAADAFMAPQADTSWTLRIGDSSSQDTTVVLDDADLTLDGGGTTTKFAIQIHGATGGTNTLDITNGSNLVVTGYKSNTNPGNAIYTHSKATDIINVTDSTYNAYGNRTGYIASGLVYVNVTRGEFNVVDNSSNGSNGGIFTAVDSKIDFSRNGSHGLSVTSLHLERSELVAEENGYTGVWVNTAGATIIDSTMAVNRNRVQFDTLGAFNLMGGDNTIDAKSRIDILENLGTGLRLNAGTLTVADGAQLTVMDNTATFGGGVEVNAGEMILPTTAIIYNNTGIDHADDIFVNDGAQLTLHPVLDGWILNEAPNENHVIDGWYDDAVDTRWSAHSDPIHIDEYTEFAAPVAGPLSLKAAHTVWIDLAGTKVWEGGAAPRPTITVRVTVDGEPVVNRFGAVVAPISLESNETTFAFTDLPKFTVDGDEIAYAVTEDMVDGYTSVLTREGTDITVTNTFVEPEKPVDPVTPITPGKPVDPVTPGKPVDPMTPITPDAPRTVKMGSTVNPKTGDHNPALIVTIMILVSAAAIFCLGFAPRRKSTH